MNQTTEILAIAARVDTAIEQAAMGYEMLRRKLPRQPHLKAKFRMSLARFNLPGSLRRLREPARALAQSLTEESSC